MDFLDFVLRLEPADGGGWTARVIESPMGEGRESLEFRFDPEESARQWFSGAEGLQNLRSFETLEEVFGVPLLEDLPRRLFESLFSGETLRLWYMGLGKASPGGLRLCLRFDPREASLAPLLKLPWELVQDPSTREFHGPSPLTPIFRHLEVAQPRPSEAIPRPLRVLLVACQPQGLGPLAVEKEARAIQEAFRDNPMVKVENLLTGCLSDLETRLGRASQGAGAECIHVLHFMGHGDFDPVTGEGCLFFEDERSLPHQVSARELALVLGVSRKSLRLLVLNACHGGAYRGGKGKNPFAGVAAALIRGGVPAVVAMQLSIADDAAVVFGQAFYRELAGGQTVEAAVAVGRGAIQRLRPGTFEWAIPALFSRLKEGYLFEPPPQFSLKEKLRRFLLQDVETLDDSWLEAARGILAGGAPTERMGQLVEPVLLASLDAGAGKLRQELFGEVAEEFTGRLLRRAAWLVCGLRIFTPSIAEALSTLRFRDEAPWPVERALREIARRDADLLPHSRRSLRRTLVRRKDHLKRFQQDPGWHRLGAAVYGGVQANGEVDPRTFHHEAKGLTPWVLKTLMAGCRPVAAVDELRELSRSGPEEECQEFLLARVALGDSLESAEIRRVISALRRLIDNLDDQGLAATVWLPALQELSQPELEEVQRWLPQSPTVLSGILGVARSTDLGARIPWLSHFFRQMLHSESPKALYNLAVTLDTHGAFLSSSPEVLARAVALAISGNFRKTCTEPLLRRRWLGTVMDCLALLPEAFGFFAGWVLVCLARDLEDEGLLPEALALALGFSDRLNAREDTLERLVAMDSSGALGSLGNDWLWHPAPAIPLTALAEKVPDLWGRFRLYRRLALGASTPTDSADSMVMTDLWRSGARQAADAIHEAEDRQWAQTQVLELQEPRAGEGLEEPPWESAVPRSRSLEADLETHWKSSPTTVLRILVARTLDTLPEGFEPKESKSLIPVSRLEEGKMHEIARAWLSHRDEDPQQALRQRWRFEAIEHDDAQALEGWAEALGTGGGAEAAEAEVILGNIQAVKGNLSDLLGDLLIRGAVPVRKALLRSLTYLLARRRLTDAAWKRISGALESLAVDNLLDGESFVIDGPRAVVAAAGAVRQRLFAPSATLDPVEDAHRVYDLFRQSWPDVLRRPVDSLRQILTAVGEEWLVSRRSRQDVEEAALRVASELPVFDVLLDWASQEMRRDVCQQDTDDYLLGDLLSILAGAAKREPLHYRDQANKLLLWERQLCEAAQEADWFPTRRAALQLLMLLERTSRQILLTLKGAEGDVPEVRQVLKEAL